MKKLLCILLTGIAITLLLQAQTPQMLNYQGVLKNADGSIQPNEQAQLKLEFLQDNEPVYIEEHSIQTNSNGYFSIHPGTGNVLSGYFDEIDWSRTPVILRSSLNGNVIAETTLTSVPYALYANRVEGQDVLESRIDSLSQTTYRMAALTDNITIQTETLQQTGDSILLCIDSLSLCIDTLSRHLGHHDRQIDSLTNNIAFYNATAAHPLPAGTYHTAASARESIPQQARKSGLIVTFRSDTLSWRSIQFSSNDTSLWNRSDKWQDYGPYGNLILPYTDSDAKTRQQVPVSNRQTGLIISYFNGEEIRNEQFTASSCTDSVWSADNSWTELLNSSHLAQIDSALARLDSVSNALDAKLQELSEQEAWFYTDHTELFSQIGGIDINGTATADIAFVHTPLIPLTKNWIVQTYSVGSHPGISFFRDENYASRIPSATDTLPSETPIQLDLANATIPEGARYFSVNMPILQKSGVSLQERTPVTEITNDDSNYNYTEAPNYFTYIGAYVDQNGKRIISSQFRHTRFIGISDKRYRISSTGMYTQLNIAPVIVYFEDAAFGTPVGYDIGYVNDDRSTSREITVSSSTAPEGAKYFVVNWIPSYGSSIIQEGSSTESMLFSAEQRIASLETNLSCYSGRKMVTLGDSFTTNTGNRGKYWQQWLAEWLGIVWSLNETNTGLNGHAAMGYGGSWIMPNDIVSMSIRCMDVSRYSPDIILLYGGENDQFNSFQWGTIDDEPFLPAQIIDLANDSTIRTLSAALSHTADTTVTPHLPRTLLHIHEHTGKKLYYLSNDTAWEKTSSWTLTNNCITFYAAYKGIVQRLCTENPNAAIYCLSLMQCDHSRYNGPFTDEGLDELRKTKCEIIKEIAEYYGVQFIDLWNNSGINNYNATSLYSDWLHPNTDGYRKLAECVYRTLK